MCFDINGNRDVKFLECDYLLVQRCVKLTLKRKYFQPSSKKISFFQSLSFIEKKLSNVWIVDPKRVLKLVVTRKSICCILQFLGFWLVCLFSPQKGKKQYWSSGNVTLNVPKFEDNAQLVEIFFGGVFQFLHIFLLMRYHSFYDSMILQN